MTPHRPRFLVARFPVCIALAVLTAACATPHTPPAASTSRDASATYPGTSWARIADPTTVGFSQRGLDSVVALTRRLNTSALMVVVGGRSLLEYGDVAETSYVASVRKSVLSMLYGRAVDAGTIRLDRTLQELGITDRGGLLPLEQHAQIAHLLAARSGVFHLASYAGDHLDSAPPRGSQQPGTYYLYSNWDFNALGTHLRAADGHNIYDAIGSDLAGPIEMQDYHRAGQHKDGDSTRPISRLPMSFSTRDMARLGLLMLRRAAGRRDAGVPRRWVGSSTRGYAPAELNPPEERSGPYGYGYLWWVGDGPDARTCDSKAHTTLKERSGSTSS